MRLQMAKGQLAVLVKPPSNDEELATYELVS